ncbi:hypothetical protein [Acetohalobium arabaticum]|uniref:hypothetical protein n=1 Tax=Acetohalobium arabaticum TaxID=28187 RepID=UPI001651A33C|nr:hypothetical protein [Acetohalobium arabaticum]
MITELDGQSEEIDKIVNLINDIAEQTNEATGDIIDLVKETQDKSDTGCRQ